MSEEQLRQLLKDVQCGKRSIDSALASFSSYPILSLSNAKIDTQRSMRTGVDEVVFAEGKSWDDLQDIVAEVISVMGRILITRITPEQIDKLKTTFNNLKVYPEARIAMVGHQTCEPISKGVAVLSAGTSDLPVMQEASLSAKYFGLSVVEISDVGISCLSRLVQALSELEREDECSVLIVVAGMEGALPSVVAGQTKLPVIAVPTSIGYGVSEGGIAAAISMLASCAPGVSVVNVDNGFGAAVCAKKIICSG